MIAPFVSKQLGLHFIDISDASGIRIGEAAHNAGVEGFANAARVRSNRAVRHE